MTGKYDDILHLPHHRSQTRSHMSLHDRAAQFAPFAALTGFDSALNEAGRQTGSRPVLEEYENALLDRAMVRLQELLPFSPEVMITSFSPDPRKNGGSCIKLQGQVKKIDFFKQMLYFTDGTELSLENILRIECELFDDE